MAFRENILYLRSANDMTQEQLSTLVGVSRQSVAKWESGKAYPEMDKLIKLSKIFDCSLDDLVQGDLTKSSVCDAEDSEYRAIDHQVMSSESSSAEVQAAQGANPEKDSSSNLIDETVDFTFESNDDDIDAVAESNSDVSLNNVDEFGYDEFMRNFAWKISMGVMFILIGTAISTVFFAIADRGAAFLPWNMDAFMTLIGVVCVFVGVALGLFCLIPAGMEHASFVRNHPVLKDFYTTEQKAEARSYFTSQLVTGIIFIFLGICLTIALNIAEITSVFAAFAMLVCTAFGVRMIINGSILLSRVNINEYNKEALRESGYEYDQSVHDDVHMHMHRKEADVRISAINGIIMIIATIAGLTMLFVPQYHTNLFWMAWPIGGLCCAVVKLLSQAITGKE